MAFAWNSCDFLPLAYWTGDAASRFALVHGGDAPAVLPPCCRHRRCWLDGRPVTAGLGPVVGKISFSPPALPTKHRRHNPAHLNLFSWGRCLSVDRRRCQVSCGPGEKSRRLPRMPCPPQEKGPFCLLFMAAWIKSKASCGTRPAVLSLTLVTIKF